VRSAFTALTGTSCSANTAPRAAGCIRKQGRRKEQRQAQHKPATGKRDGRAQRANRAAHERILRLLATKNRWSERLKISCYLSNGTWLAQMPLRSGFPNWIAMARTTLDSFELGLVTLVDSVAWACSRRALVRRALGEGERGLPSASFTGRFHRPLRVKLGWMPPRIRCDDDGLATYLPGLPVPSGAPFLCLAIVRANPLPALLIQLLNHRNFRQP